jgi:outer membrane lipopolysaccharide assembly protein LptE/RlpB
MAGTRPTIQAGSKRSRGRTALLLALLLVLSSCGYSASPTLSSSIKRIYIPTFENETTRYGIEQDLTEAVVNAFTSDNRLTVVSERDADVMLRGVIIRYEKGALTFDRAATVDEFRVSISISVVLEDLRQGKVLWEDDTMSAWDSYNEADTGATSEDAATAKVMDTLAKDIVSRTIEGW